MGRWSGPEEHVITMRRLVAADAGALSLFLTDLDNQLLIAEALLCLPEPNGGGPSLGPLSVRAPLGLRRRVHVGAPDRGDCPDVVVPIALGGREVGRLRWSFEALPAVTGVELAVELQRASAPVRAFLALGGRRWLERRLGEVLAALAEVALLAA